MDNKYNIVRLVLQSGVQSIFYYVNEWNVDEVVKLLNYNGYQTKDFRYFWFESRERMLSRDLNEVELLRVETRVLTSSSSYYINAYVETLDDIIARNDKDEYWLVEKMKNLNWQQVVTSIEPKEDWHYHFKDGDYLVNLEGNIVNESVV